MNLREWRESKGWDQSDLAAKLGKPRPTYQKMEAGAAPIRPKEQEKIRKLGYTGPMPREEAAAPAGGPYAMASEIAELRGAMRAHVEQWERGTEKLLRELLALGQRIDKLEKGEK